LSGYLTAQIPDRILQYMFVLFVLFSLYRLMTAPEKTHESETRTVSKWLLLVIGIGIGIVSISIGVGGAIILIPLLSGFLHYPIKKAVSAGLFFVVFSSVAGFLGRLIHGQIDLINGTIIGIASLFGVCFGIWLKDRVHARQHKNFIVGMYLFILGIMAYKMFLN